MSDETSKRRFNVTLTESYLKALDQLVEAGVYVNHQEIVKDALRIVFRLYEMKPFVKPLEAGEA